MLFDSCIPNDEGEERSSLTCLTMPLPFLVSALVISFLDYCNTLLSGLPAYKNSANGAKQLMSLFSLFMTLHWLKSLMLTYRVPICATTTYMNSLCQVYALFVRYHQPMNDDKFYHHCKEISVQTLLLCGLLVVEQIT